MAQWLRAALATLCGGIRAIATQVTMSPALAWNCKRTLHQATTTQRRQQAVLLYLCYHRFNSSLHFSELKERLKWTGKERLASLRRLFCFLRTTESSVDTGGEGTDSWGHSRDSTPASTWLTCNSSLGIRSQQVARVVSQPREVVMATPKLTGSARLFLQRQGSGEILRAGKVPFVLRLRTALSIWRPSPWKLDGIHITDANSCSAHNALKILKDLPRPFTFLFVLSP